MTDRGLEIIQKRMDLKNLLDQAAAKQRDLNHLDRAVDELNNYPKDFKNSLKTWGRKRLKILYEGMSNEEIDMIYERIHIT